MRCCCSSGKFMPAGLEAPTQCSVQGPRLPLHLLPPWSQAPAGGQAPRPFTRPISNMASRSLEETCHTIPRLASCRNEDFPAAPLKESDANDETQVPDASPQGTMEQAAWATSTNRSGRAPWNHSGPSPLQEATSNPAKATRLSS